MTDKKPTVITLDADDSEEEMGRGLTKRQKAVNRVSFPSNRGGSSGNTAVTAGNLPMGGPLKEERLGLNARNTDDKQKGKRKFDKTSEQNQIPKKVLKEEKADADPVLTTARPKTKKIYEIRGGIIWYENDAILPGYFTPIRIIPDNIKKESDEKAAFPPSSRQDRMTRKQAMAVDLIARMPSTSGEHAGDAITVACGGNGPPDKVKQCPVRQSVDKASDHAQATVPSSSKPVVQKAPIAKTDSEALIVKIPIIKNGVRPRCQTATSVTTARPDKGPLPDKEANPADKRRMEAGADANAGEETARLDKVTELDIMEVSVIQALVQHQHGTAPEPRFSEAPTPFKPTCVGSEKPQCFFPSHLKHIRPMIGLPNSSEQKGQLDSGNTVVAASSTQQSQVQMPKKSPSPEVDLIGEKKTTDNKKDQRVQDGTRMRRKERSPDVEVLLFIKSPSTPTAQRQPPSDVKAGGNSARREKGQSPDIVEMPVTPATSVIQRRKLHQRQHDARRREKRVQRRLREKSPSLLVRISRRTLEQLLQSDDRK